MSARSESAATPSPCACTNISLMQLFHELKQKFPGVPDHVVSNTIELYCHDKQACETHLHREVKASLTHAYHASSSAAARRLNELKVNPPSKCRNQPIVKQEVAKSTPCTSVTCQRPQTAILSSPTNINNDSDKKVSTDANQNVVEHIEEKVQESNNNTTPITVINIDNCCVKYNAETPSDWELTNENTSSNSTSHEKEFQQPESTNYKIFKSNKIKSNLNERLEKGKEKKTVRKEEPKQVLQDKSPQSPQERPVQTPEKPTQVLLDKPAQEKVAQIPQVKPERPKTLDFIKPNPDIAFKQTLKEPEVEPNRTVSPIPPKQEQHSQPKDTPYRPERGYPLNLSVNVNCHMDLSRFDNPWLEDYDSPRAITSVNLTVCTPTSSMASPVREMGEDDGGFEGHVTVTVSPSTTRAPRRRAPPPPGSMGGGSLGGGSLGAGGGQPSRMESPRPSRAAPGPPGTAHDNSEDELLHSSDEEWQLLPTTSDLSSDESTYTFVNRIPVNSDAKDRSLIERQKERRDRLAKALEEEKRRLAQLTRETEILAAPPPAPSAAQSLKEHVERLRSQCDTLSKRLEMRSSDPDEPDNFYSNIYTGQRPASYWQCHMCTFRNFPLLNRCEECDMPRIYVGTSVHNTQDSGIGSLKTVSTHDVARDDTYVLVENNRALSQLNC